MAYEIEFTTTVDVTDPEIYINDCCWGGDVVCDRLLPAVSTTGLYESVKTGQEDWGWYIWMRQKIELTRIHIQCDENEAGEFRIHIFSSKKRWLLWKDIDTPDVERVQQVTISEIKKWGIIKRVQRLTPDFMTEL
jgi:hypothetical protein